MKNKIISRTKFCILHFASCIKSSFRPLPFTFYLLPFALSLPLAGCMDVLDVAPDGNLTMEEVYSDPVKVEALLATIYAGVPEKGFNYVEFTPLFTAISDDGWEANGEYNALPSYWVYHGTNTADWHMVANAQGGNGITQKNYWGDFFTSIRLCNQFINNADKMVFTSDASRNRLIAEAHVLRAYFYTDLIKLFGPVPIIDQVLPLDFDFSVLVRNPVYDVAKFVAADCDAALAKNELPWRISTGGVEHNGQQWESSGEVFRATKALAHTLKATAMLFAASPLHNAGANHWEEAYQFGKQAVEALERNGYELYTTCTQPNIFGTGGAAAFHEMMCKMADYSAAPRDRETIYQTTSSIAENYWTSKLWHVNYAGTALPGTAYVGTTPTQELVDAFEYVTADGSSYPLLDLEQPYLDENHLQPNFNQAAINAGYAAENYIEKKGSNPYANRDPRMYATLLANGDVIDYPPTSSVTVNIYIGDSTVTPKVENGPFAIGTNPGDRGHTKTGYLYRKTITPGTSSVGDPATPLYKHYRFAELLLDLAETANEAGHPEDVLPALNRVRARVGMPPVTETDKNKLRLRIKNERRVEFAFEENRYYDLRRWSEPTGDLGKYQKYPTAMWITKHADGSFSYERKNIWNEPRGGWTNRDLLLPLPIAEVARMEPLTGVEWQNPGW